MSPGAGPARGTGPAGGTVHAGRRRTALPTGSALAPAPDQGDRSGRSAQHFLAAAGAGLGRRSDLAVA
ncbi:hypothetical protein ACFPRL_12665 [Pseudoclavibacter helvolus]